MGSHALKPAFVTFGCQASSPGGASAGLKGLTTLRTERCWKASGSLDWPFSGSVWWTKSRSTRSPKQRHKKIVEASQFKRVLAMRRSLKYLSSARGPRLKKFPDSLFASCLPWRRSSHCECFSPPFWQPAGVAASLRWAFPSYPLSRPFRGPWERWQRKRGAFRWGWTRNV